MDVFEEIIKLANKKIYIEYSIVNQEENGNKKIYGNDIQDITYTIYIGFESYYKNPIDDMSFDDLEEGLKWGIEIGKKYLEKVEG